MTQYKKVTGDYINNIEDFINDVLMTDELPGSQKNLFRTGVRVDYLPGSKKTNTIITPSGKVAIILKLEDGDTKYSITDPFKTIGLDGTSFNPGSILAKDVSDKDSDPISQKLMIAKKNSDGILEFEPKIIHKIIHQNENESMVYFTSEMDYSHSLDEDYSVYKLTQENFDSLDKTLVVLDPMQNVRVHIYELDEDTKLTLDHIKVGNRTVSLEPLNTPEGYDVPDEGKIMDIDILNLLGDYDDLEDGKIELKLKVEDSDREYFTVRIW